MSRIAVVATIVLAFPICAQEPLTVAEKSDYKATSKHSEVLEFCEALAAKSPVVRFTDMGTSGDGKKLPLLILADPPISTPAEAKASGKLVAYVQANIHAGEVDGKEGLLMLARDIALGKDRALLKDLVLALLPRFQSRRQRQDRSEQSPEPKWAYRRRRPGERAKDSISIAISSNWKRPKSAPSCGS